MAAKAVYYHADTSDFETGAVLWNGIFTFYQCATLVQQQTTTSIVRRIVIALFIGTATCMGGLAVSLLSDLPAYALILYFITLAISIIITPTEIRPQSSRDLTEGRSCWWASYSGKAHIPGPGKGRKGFLVKPRTMPQRMYDTIFNPMGKRLDSTCYR